MFGLLVNLAIAGIVVASAVFVNTWGTSDYPAKHRLAS